MSIVPSQLNISTNLSQVEQNQTVVVAARLIDQYGNPIPNEDISLYIDHSDYTSMVLVRQGTSDAYGKTTFEIALRSVGDSHLCVESSSLKTKPIVVQVLPSSLPPPGPGTWTGVVRSLSRVEIDLNTLIGHSISKGLRPTKQELCTKLGLDYDRANDRARVSQALYSLKDWFDYLWRALYQASQAFDRDFSTLMNDTTGYSNWKNDPNSPYPYLKAYYHQSEDEIRELWVLSGMWDRFVQVANQYNLHLFVGYYDTTNKLWRYKQPSFWEYVEKQIWSASRLSKGMQTILGRHRDLGMILTSGESIHKALEEAQMVRKMITDRSTPKFRCLMCWNNGIVFEWSSQEEFASHVKSSH